MYSVFLPFFPERVQTGYASPSQPEPLTKTIRNSTTALNPRVNVQATFSLCKCKSKHTTLKCFFVIVRGYHYYLKTSEHLKLMIAHCCKDTSSIFPSPPHSHLSVTFFKPECGCLPSMCSCSGIQYPIYILDVEYVCVPVFALWVSMLFQWEHLIKRRSFPITLLFWNSLVFTIPQSRKTSPCLGPRAPSVLGPSRESRLWWGQGPGALPGPLSRDHLFANSNQHNSSELTAMTTANASRCY